uniref:USP domain-containing protein n=1 Tax=Sinocyclocheilus rhinocerous TaxID=307959 RepID=A0A673HNY9_9TELE
MHWTNGFTCVTSVFRNEVQYNGLKNQGATCYLNAVLQCLFMTPKFREAVVSQHCWPVLNNKY